MEMNTEIFSLFYKKWALAAAGTPDSFNAMTIAWGTLGTLWERPVACIYIRTSRHTHKFLDESDYFTVSFYPESSREALQVFGTKSGKDFDKMHYDGLTVKPVGDTVTFEEAEITLVCRKLIRQRLEQTEVVPDVAAEFYVGDVPHDMYVGEVVEILA